MGKMDWNSASNSEMENELKRLDELFEEKKKIMMDLHNEMVEMSAEYNEINEILEKRRGKGK